MSPKLNWSRRRPSNSDNPQKDRKKKQMNLTWTMDTRTSAWKSGSQTLACGPYWAFFVPHLQIPLFGSALETRIDDRFCNHQSLAICCVNSGEKRVKCQLIITYMRCFGRRTQNRHRTCQRDVSWLEKLEEMTEEREAWTVLPP